MDKIKYRRFNEVMWFAIFLAILFSAQISFGDQKLPIPNAGTGLAEYAGALKKAGFDPKLSNKREGDEGYGIETEGLILPTGDFRDAYQIAQKLFQIPDSVKFPENGTLKEQKIEIPHDKKVWEHSIEIKRNNSEIKELTYYYRVEGGGTTGHLIKLGPHQIRIELSGISD